MLLIRGEAAFTNLTIFSRGNNWLKC